jgi:hypothetical protein
MNRMLGLALSVVSVFACTSSWHKVESAAGTFKFPCEPRREVQGSVTLWGCESEGVWYQVAAGAKFLPEVTSATLETAILAAFVESKKAAYGTRVIWEGKNDQSFPLVWLCPGEFPGEHEYGIAFYRAEHFVRITATYGGETLPSDGYSFLRTNRP